MARRRSRTNHLTSQNVLRDEAVVQVQPAKQTRLHRLTFSDLRTVTNKAIKQAVIARTVEHKAKTEKARRSANLQTRMSSGLLKQVQREHVTRCARAKAVRRKQYFKSLNSGGGISRRHPRKHRC